VEAPVEAPEDDLAIPEPDGVAAPLEGSAPAETKPKSPAIPGERSPEQQAFEPEAPAEDAAEDKEAAEEEDEDSPAARKKRREKLRKNPKKWPHNGLVFELQVGTQGCFRRYCHGEANLNAGPGFRLFGFLGGNAYGILDFGISFGWGTLGAGDVTGKNAIGIYELDPNILQNIAVDTFGVDVFNVDLTRLNVQDVSLRTVDVGPALRIHFLRRGRFDPFVGVGIHYMLWRGRYETDVGKARLDFHGVGVPFEIGMNVFVHPNIAVGANFSYLHTHYFLASFQHPDANGLAPLALLDPAVVSTEEDTTFHDGLPRFWTLTFGARTRF
ncbi:MAG: outer membrane beta-barrel protein, partial [Myxococcales bacterium]|nr:outer membrane beta-barrel protein [Myxococcales bacterium]